MSAPTPRTVKNSLAKVFDAILSPVYLVDVSGTIVYVNEAMLQWAGCKLDQIIGAQCIYSAIESGTEQRFNGLAPPPDKLKPGSTITGCQISLSSPGLLQQRLCDFVALAAPNDPNSAEFVVGFVADENQAVNSDVNTDVYDAENLHAELGKLQHQLQQRFSLDSLIGNSEFAVRLRKQVVAAGGNGLEMTIVGPPGSGRQHLARTIHQRRSTASLVGTDAVRSRAPGLAAVLQGAIADAQLVQSSVRQAISFAKENQSENRGRAGGRHLPVAWLIVLDADQLSAEAQTELWSALTDSRSDVRVIATAEVDLIRASTDGTFHQGLAWRINTLVIDTIALKQRSRDIPMLAQYFLEQHNEAREQQIGRFDSDAIEMLTEYRWPGNLRQLRSVIQQAADACTSAVVSKSDLPETFHHALKALRMEQQSEVHIDLDQYLENIEAQLISRAIKVAKGNKTQTAKLLGMNRAKLLRRIQHLELDAEATAARTGLPTQNSETQVDFQPVDAADEVDGPEGAETGP